VFSRQPAQCGKASGHRRSTQSVSYTNSVPSMSRLKLHLTAVFKQKITPCQFSNQLLKACCL